MGHLVEPIVYQEWGAHMSKTVTKVFLHPLFHFFLFLGATVLFISMGIAETGFFCWVNFILALIFFGSVIDKGLKSVSYFRKN